MTKKEDEIVHEWLSKNGKKGGKKISADKDHMSKIGKKGRATLVRNIIAKAEGKKPEEVKVPAGVH